VTGKRDLILAIDSGTQNVKAAVFDREGKELALARFAHEPDSAPRPRWVEHDPEDYWDKMCRATRQALSAIGPDIARIGAVGLTSQRGTTIPVDADGNVLRPAIVYLDNRVTEGLPKVGGFWGLFFAAIGRKTAIEYVRSHSRFLWIKTNQPEVYAQTHTFFQVASFLNFRLTGRTNESVGMMVGMFPLDYKKLTWYPQKGIHDVFGVSPGLLPELMRPLSVTGHITREASEQTLIPEGLPVIVGGGDVQAGVVGMGVTGQDTAALILGTTIDFDVPTTRFVNDEKLRFLCWPAAVPDSYILEAGVGGGFLTVTWFTNELAHYEKELSRLKGTSPEELLDVAVRDVPAGSLGLIAQPYWTPPFHRQEARGAIVGLTMAHSRAHIYRAILEGFAYEIRAGYEVMAGKTGVPIREIRVSGGGAKSDAILSIVADVLGVPARRMEVQESSALGAALCAGVGSGMFSSIGEAIERMVHVRQEFLPDRGNQEVYETMYRSYQGFYPRVADLYRETEAIASRTASTTNER
jgi:sugar (pentulose or hexulose) kinase